ncbi:MAG: EAL domain-containing protein [Gammaproteobacteria bacterium]|nr:EAL domain-containing protein [Gammaproteobacteria bacterium]
MHVNLDEIEEALTNGHFFLEYLPIMKLEGSACVGAEALIRWRRQSEVVPPADFVPAIENTPLSGLVTYWVMETVAHELGDWLRGTERALITINVPPEILGRGGLWYVASKCGMLDILGKLVVEVTERGVPDQLGIQALKQSKKHGLKVCLDDVGTSDENLVLLMRANIDMMKLDKSFADKMRDPDWSPESMNGLTAFAQSTPVQVIAEGVETEFQRNTFREAGIQMAQGWFFSPPLSAAKFIEFFRANTD